MLIQPYVRRWEITKTWGILARKEQNKYICLSCCSPEYLRLYQLHNIVWPRFDRAFERNWSPTNMFCTHFILNYKLIHTELLRCRILLLASHRREVQYQIQIGLVRHIGTSWRLPCVFRGKFWWMTCWDTLSQQRRGCTHTACPNPRQRRRSLSSSEGSLTSFRRENVRVWISQVQGIVSDRKRWPYRVNESMSLKASLDYKHEPITTPGDRSFRNNISIVNIILRRSARESYSSSVKLIVSPLNMWK
jgi:hypothetical protein